MKEVHLIAVKYLKTPCLVTRPGSQLEASSKQHETICWRLKSEKVTSVMVTIHIILLVVGVSIYTYSGYGGNWMAQTLGHPLTNWLLIIRGLPPAHWLP